MNSTSPGQKSSATFEPYENTTFGFALILFYCDFDRIPRETLHVRQPIYLRTTYFKILHTRRKFWNEKICNEREPEIHKVACLTHLCFGVVIQVKDREAYYTDLQLLRVTKKLQAVLKGDRGEKDKELVQKTEASVEMMERAHESKVLYQQHLNNDYWWPY